MLKKIYKLIDKSVVLGTEIDSTETTVTVKAPLNVTQMMNPQTMEPEITMIPMDLIFADVVKGKDIVVFKKEHIMYEKDMTEFPNYEQNYVAQTTGIEMIQKSGIIC